MCVWYCVYVEERDGVYMGVWWREGLVWTLRGRVAVRERVRSQHVNTEGGCYNDTSGHHIVAVNTA